jgi:hypothetical protein
MLFCLERNKVIKFHRKECRHHSLQPAAFSRLGERLNFENRFSKKKKKEKGTGTRERKKHYSNYLLTSVQK